MIFQPTVITCRKTELRFLSLNLKVHESCISSRKDIFKDFYILGAKHCGQGTMPFVFEDCCIRPFQLFANLREKKEQEVLFKEEEDKGMKGYHEAHKAKRQKHNK